MVAIAVAVVLVTVGIATANRWFPGTGGRPSTPALAAGPACGYKVALLGRLSDALGVGIRDTARLAVEQYNGAHVGCGVELVEFDTTGAPNRASGLAQEIVADEKILGVVGPVHGDEVNLAMSWLESGKVAAVSPSAPDSDLSQRGWSVFHRMVGSDRDDAVAGVTLLTNVLRVQKIFVVDDRSTVAVEVADEVERRLGASAVGTASIDGQPATVTATIAQIRLSGADSVYYSGFSTAGSALVEQLRTAQPNITIVGSVRLFANEFLTIAGPQANGTYVTSPVAPNLPGSFADAYEARYGTVAPYLGSEAFDATNILLSGLAAGRATRTDMLSWVDRYDGAGVSRHARFNADGDLALPQVWFLRVVDGAFVAESVIPDK
jgi:branched-chain amino acid transport system substrate-binding protein